MTKSTTPPTSKASLADTFISSAAIKSTQAFGFASNTSATLTTRWLQWGVSMLERFSANLPSHMRQSLIETLQEQQEQADEGSRNNAVNRLKAVLLQDRTNLEADTLESLKADILATIAKYVDIDPETMQLELEQQAAGASLSANVTVLRERAPEEIAAATTEAKPLPEKPAEALVDEADDLIAAEETADKKSNKAKRA